MMYYRLRIKYMALLTAQAILKHFIVPVASATAASVKATLSLPQTIVTAIEDSKEAAQVEARLDDALIDKDFLNRASVGLNAEESDRVKTLVKGL